MSSRKVRCCVRNCPAQTMEELTYFSLPVDIDRRLSWLRAIGRPDMTSRDDLKPKNHVVCSIHFDESQVSILKQTLPDAIPTRYVPREVKGVFKTCSSVRTQTDFSSSDSDSDSDSDSVEIIDDSDDSEEGKKRKIDSDDQTESKRLKHDESSQDLDNNTSAAKESIVPSNIAIKTWNKFFEWKDRTTNRRRGKKFDKDFSVFALNLHTINTRAYKLLMKTWQLPSETKLKSVELKIGPRFDDQMISLLSQKFQSLSKEGKYCTLCLYAMKLKSHFYYDTANDDIIGVHNVNGIRTKEAASFVLVAMVRGIKVKWCQPLTYAFLSTMPDLNNMDVFITNLLVKLNKMKMVVLALVIPDDAWFEKYFRSQKFMTVSKPFILFDKEKLHVVYDVPHLLNRLRDDFMVNDFIYKGDTVSWEYIKQVYSLVKDKTSRLLPKLTDEHLEPKKKEKGLKYPCQVFSKSVAAAISFYTDHGLIEENARRTVDFISKINDIFDTLNLNKVTRVLRDNAKTYECQQKLRIRAQNKALEDGFNMFKNLKAIKNGEDTTSGLKSLEYFQVTLKSLINVASDLKDANQFGIIQARYTYLEPMQEFLKLVEKDAISSRPTPIQFTRAFSKLFVKYLVELTPPPASITEMADFLKMADDIKDTQAGDSTKKIRLKDTDYRFALPDEHALIYLCSFLIYKCSKVHKCKGFNNYVNGLVDLNETKINIHFEDLNKEAEFYNRLKCPTDEFAAYIESLDDYYLNKFDEFFRMHPAITIHESLKYVPQCDFPCSCFPTEYLLILFVRTRIYETMIYNTRCLKERLVANTTYKLKVKKL